MKSSLIRPVMLALFLSFLCCPTLAHASIPGSDPFSVSWGTSRLSMEPGATFETSIAFSVPDGYYLYADKVEVEFISLEGIHIDDLHFPDGTVKEDPLTGKSVEVYDRDVAIGVRGHVPVGLASGERELITRVGYQGCSEKLCFRPQEKMIALVVEVGVSRGLRPLLDATDFSSILDRGLILTVLIVLLAGILTSLTPCVWPIIPVVLVVIGVERQRSFVRNVLLACSLVAGLILVFSLLGILAAALGRNLGFVFQQRWFLALIAVFFIAMSLSMFGIFEIRISSLWAHRLHNLGGEGFRGAFLSGMGLGLIASPCSGPVIAALLAYVAFQKSYLMGFVLLVIYGIGMGMMFILLGAIYGVVANKLRGGPWMVWVRRALGVILLIPAAFYVGSLLHWNGTSAMQDDRPHVEWVLHLEDGIQFASDTGRPVMIDFYADWCLPCRKLDRRFFQNEDIVKLSYQLVPVRVDATHETPSVRKLLERYHVMGMPTFVFLSPRGVLYEDLRVASASTCLVERSMKEAIRRTGGTKAMTEDEVNEDQCEAEGEAE